MGFGTLFVGTVLTVNIAAHGYTDLIAYLLFLLALLRLREYNRKFQAALYSVLPLLFAGIWEFGLNVADLLDIYRNEQFLQEAYLLNQVALYFTTALILRGIGALAIDTDVPTIRVRAFRNQILAFIYHGCMVFLSLSTKSNAVANVQQTMLLPVLLYGFIYLILQAKLIFSCYMWICPEEDAAMNSKTSRFAFLNRLRTFDNNMDDRTATRIAEDRKRRADKKKNKKN